MQSIACICYVTTPYFVSFKYTGYAFYPRTLAVIVQVRNHLWLLLSVNKNVK